MIIVNFDHIIYFDAEINEFLEYRFSAMVNVKVTWSDWKTQSISSFDSKNEMDWIFYQRVYFELYSFYLMV